MVALQSEGTVRPADAAAYRIAVTTLDQDSAEVLTELAAFVHSSDTAAGVVVNTTDAQRFCRDVEEHWRYSQAATVASGSIEMQRILLARSLLAAA